ncbi:MAG TPA: sigma-70 family RNA polymerase sigma factor [Bryobacteraceae bacterium]|jgi:RNA polymerase sigma-70 factor (ECF subfamily)|nr:sigma-70 family RNA polymerase sigma factor [Bryobacteraceae bacterium]
MSKSEAVCSAVAGSRGQVDAGGAREAAWKEYVGRCVLEDPGALGRLYDESGSLVYSLALRVLGNEADAEEVTLDVYTQVWRRAAGYDPERGSVTAWLLTIARSRSIDKVRSRAGRTSLEQPLEKAGEARTNAAGPEEHTAMGQQRRRVLAALNTLKPEQRRALELAYFSGLSHSELADRLGLPLGTVKTRIRLGMMKLRELLVDYA